MHSLSFRIHVNSFPDMFQGMVDINGDDASRVSVSSDVAAEQESNASSNLTASGAAQPDEQATIDLRSCHAETIELNHTDVTRESGLGRAAGFLPVDDDQGSG